MKANEKPLLVLAVAMLLNIATVQAQFLKDLSIGLNGGAYVYQGDLTPSFFGSVKTASPGFSLYAQKPVSDYLSFRLNFSASKLKGDESLYNSPAYRQQRAFMFSSPLKEVSGLALWNIKGSNYANNGIAPYFFAGVGFSFMNIKPDYTRVDTSTTFKDPTIFTNISRDVAHGTPRILPVIPIGAGIEFPLSSKLLLTTEAAYRFTFTDYIDGFSFAANPNGKDSYYSVSIGLRYRLNSTDDGSGRNKGVGCPTNVFSGY